jgi:predicted acetyltransferase
MPQLVAPTTRVHTSFLKAMAELQAEGRGEPDDNTMIASEIRSYGATWHEPDAFDRYTADLRAQSHEGAPSPAGHVPCTTLWWVAGEDYIGRLAIRHRLTDWLVNYGGHIGYDVRPTARRLGHATRMLRAALPVAAGLGIGQALITCDHTNVASRKVIEANGGRFDDERAGKLRFWVPTGAQT